jgi:hypothetical protein
MPLRTGETLRIAVALSCGLMEGATVVADGDEARRTYAQLTDPAEDDVFLLTVAGDGSVEPSIDWERVGPDDE